MRDPLELDAMLEKRYGSKENILVGGIAALLMSVPLVAVILIADSRFYGLPAAVLTIISGIISVSVGCILAEPICWSLNRSEDRM